MGRIIGAYVFPHPPLIIPEIGKGSESGAAKTVEAAKKAALDIAADKPSTIVLTTPHGPVFQDFIYISDSPSLVGNLSQFGAADVKFHFENNLDLMQSIIEKARGRGISCGGLNGAVLGRYGLPKELDHGAMVPLYYVQKEYPDFKLVHISISGLPFRQLYRFGMCIAEAVSDSEDEVVFIASGDLSHKLSKDAPYGYNKRGREFDDLIIDTFKSLDVDRLIDIDDELCDSAGECGLRSFIMMFGALDGFSLSPDVYSYEGPFGVGYSIARFGVNKPDESRKLYDKMTEKNVTLINNIRSNEDPYVKLARQTLETFVKEKRVMEVPLGLLPEMLEKKAGTFVSIKKEGHLRGCIGTTAPTKKNIAAEIVSNAINSGSRDPRFYPVEENELESLVYSVDVLGEQEPIESIGQLDVKRYGVIVETETRSGLLLPDLEGVDTVEKQVSIALQKAGIKQSDKYSMKRFEVIRHK